MTTAHVEPTLQDLPDGPGVLTEANDGQIMRWDAGQGRMVMIAIPRPVVLSSAGGGAGGGGGSGGGSQAPHTHDALYAPISHNHDGVYALVGHTHEGGDDHDHNGTYAPANHDHDDRYVMLADYTAADVLAKLLTVDGTGSGLDADLLDGLNSDAFAEAGHTHDTSHEHDADYAPLVHVHAGEDITSGTIADARIASTITRDSEVFGIVLAADGAGSGLDADLLDGLNSTAFEAAGAVATHAALTAAHGATGAVVGTTNTQTLTNKTLTTPTIGSFANAGHDHTNAAGGGQLGTGALTDAAVTNAKLANMAQSTVKGRASGAGTGVPTDLSASQVATIVESSITHNNLTGLTAGDPHTQYALLAGRSGGQILIGGTGSGHGLALYSTSHATKGKVFLGSQLTTVFDEANNRFGVLNASPLYPLHVGAGSDTLVRTEATVAIQVAGTTTLALRNATDDVETDIIVGASSAFWGTSTNHPLNFITNNATKMSLSAAGNLGIGTSAPQGLLHGHDGTGGCLFAVKTGIVNSNVTIIPDGTGDVVRILSCSGVVRTTDNVVVNVISVSGLTPGSTVDQTYSGGADVIRFEVTAAGAFVVRRVVGSKTYEIAIWAVWM